MVSSINGRSSHLRVGMGTLALVRALGGRAFGSAAGDDGGGQSLVGGGRRLRGTVGGGLTADGQIEGGEVSSTGKGRGHDEALVVEVLGGGLGDGTVLLVGGAELGQLGVHGPVHSGLVAAVLVVVVLVLDTVLLDLFIASTSRGG